jgi:5'-nucleotidase
MAALVARYEAAAGPRAARPAGHLIGAGRRPEEASSESALGDLLADAQLAATRAPDAGNARIAFTNAGGIRADLTPAADGTVTYGQIFAVQPFGNVLTVKSMTGRQILAVLEQQFVANPARGGVPYLLLPSSTFRYGYDLARAPGARVVDAMVEGVPLDPDKIYRVTMNGFLASGGDGFPAFRDGTDPLGGPQDVDALERYLSGPDRIALPVPDRIRNLGAK